MEYIQETLSVLTDQIAIKANEKGLEMPAKKSRVGHLIGIRFSESEAVAISKKLAGHRVYISFRGTTMRIATHLYR